MIEKLAKIARVKFGFGGYQDCQIVFEFQLEGPGWGTIHTMEGGWGHVSEKELAESSNFKWTHPQRIKQLGEASWKVFEIMKKAKVRNLQELEGKPVRVFFESELGPNKGFEILEEVL